MNYFKLKYIKYFIFILKSNLEKKMRIIKFMYKRNDNTYKFFWLNENFLSLKTE